MTNPHQTCLDFSPLVIREWIDEDGRPCSDDNPSTTANLTDGLLQVAANEVLDEDDVLQFVDELRDRIFNRAQKLRAEWDEA